MRLLDISAIKSIIHNIGLTIFYQRLIKQLEEDFSQWHTFYKSPRHAIHYKHGVIELMPCSDDEFYSFKYVNGHPNNTAEGNLCVVAMGMLADVKTGYPLMITEMTFLTAIRTAAVAALGAKFLARKDCTKLAIIGCGAQSEFQAIAMQSVLPISQVNIFDIDTDAMNKFSNNLSENFKQITCCTSAIEAISDADIIITVTAANKNATLFSEENVARGTHIHAMGGDGPGKTELGTSLLKNSKLIVEYSPQSLVEGEIQQLDESYIHAELWEIINGLKTGRENNHEVTIFDSVGFAIEDYSILKVIYEISEELDCGTKVDLIPDIDNPKDLYGLLKQ
ncbi:MAG: ornithine cyclodeaminase [endosymbiont of Galathealinum brachiosum]|uniref:Ornithine cyclodeaminase n=1 Tax=endosymbiont of Galathealinum brachiosum TaxID=2200906 RepID=A0A370DK68_9GAMM|nr:MAG: ornithine cyclodeaminase [endosymbiont of Galathealinum brachiosum]